MAEIVRMPKLSDTMTEGTVSRWLKKVGDAVKAGEILAEIDSDKATMEFESFYDGVLLYIGVEDKKSAPIDSILAIIGKKGEEISSILEAEKKRPVQAKSAPVPAAPSSPPVEKKEPVKAKPVEPAVPRPVTVPVQPGIPIKASPLAKRLAKEKNLLISEIAGSGDGGRVTKKDIEQYLHTASSGQASMPAKESYHDEPLTQMRKTIARRLTESKTTSPHFYLTVEIQADELVRTRNIINEAASLKLSYNDLLVKAVAASLREHPGVNASWMNDSIRYYDHIHIGIAVSVEDGLVVPVIRFADQKPLSQIAAEAKDFAQKARDKKLQPADWEGNTFTISNLGMYGIDEFTAIINPPDSCILAVGGIKEAPVVKDGKVVTGLVMKVTLSCDHRIVDGVKGSEFLQTLKAYLENPVLFLGAGSV